MDAKLNPRMKAFNAFFEQWHKNLPTIPRIDELSRDELLLACSAAAWNAALEWDAQETRDVPAILRHLPGKGDL
jgi:hypothetical protein